MTGSVVGRFGGSLVVDVKSLAQLREAHRNGVTVDRRLLELLSIAERLEAAYQALAPVSNLEPRTVSTVDSFRKPLGASEVARLVGLSRQAVTKAARTGRLIGTRTGDGWRFTRDAVDDWTARRRGG